MSSGRWFSKDNISFGCAILLGFATAYAAFVDEADAWPLLVLTVFFLLAPYWSSLSSVQISGSGISAKLEKQSQHLSEISSEAEKLIAQLRETNIETLSL